MGLADAFRSKMDSQDEPILAEDQVDDVDAVEVDALDDDDQTLVQEHFASEDADPAMAESGFGERIGNIEDADDYESVDLYGNSDETTDADYTEDDEPRASM